VSAICPAHEPVEGASHSHRGFVNGGDGMPVARGPAPDDLADAVVYTLRQPRRLRTGLWTMWSTVEVV
jgi:hypothetical protein